MWSSYSTNRRTVWNGVSSSIRPYRRVRVSLYHRSALTWLFAYSFAKTYESGSPATFSLSGVDPPEPASPTGLISRTSMPSWSATARRMASPRFPVTSRWAVLPFR